MRTDDLMNLGYKENNLSYSKNNLDLGRLSKSTVPASRPLPARSASISSKEVLPLPEGPIIARS